MKRNSQHAPPAYSAGAAAWVVFVMMPPVVAAQDGLPSPSAPTGEQAVEASLETYEQRLGYAIGVNYGMNLRQDGLPVDVDAVAAGIADMLAGREPRLSEQQRREVFTELRERMQTNRRQMVLAQMSPAAKAAATKNRQTGEAFLATNATKPGVQTTASGLQYRVVQAGEGASPTIRDQVRCNYEGRLIDGQVFDSSARHGGPATFPVGGVIAGWTEALQLMKVGGKWELYIPSGLAYGIQGSPPTIGPDQTLIFEIELLEVTKR
ncbi:MAG: FKBP-type peptidyl-prolyl cis-trans isomerase [Planctomycetota bacterium]